MKKINIIFLVWSFFIFLSALFAGIVCCDVLDKNVGIGTEGKTSIRNFEEQIKKTIEDADSFARNKEFTKAKEYLQSASVLVKEKISSYENEAKSLASKGENSGAKIYYRAASSLSKLDIQISELLAQFASLEEKQKSRKLREESAAYTEEGFKYLRAGDVDEAQVSFEKAVKISPDNRRAKDGLARVEKTYRRLNLQRVSQLLKSARNNIRAGDFDSAEKYLRQVLELEPGDRRALRYLENIDKKRQEKEYKNLLADIDRKIEEGKNNFDEGKLEEAESGLKETLGILPPAEKSRRRKIESLLASISKSRQKYQAKLNAVEGLIDEGKQCLEDEQLDKAETLLRKALKMSPSEGKQFEIQFLLDGIDKRRQAVYNEKFQNRADKNKAEIADDASSEKKELKQEEILESIRRLRTRLEDDVNQLIEQIRSKISES